MARRPASGTSDALIRHGPRARVRTHDWIDERSRSLGEAIAQHLRADPELVADALSRLRNWERSAIAHSDRRVLPVLHEWRTLLTTLTLDDLAVLVSEDSPRAARLRQSSPFAGVLSDEERRAIFQRFEEL